MKDDCVVDDSSGKDADCDLATVKGLAPVMKKNLKEMPISKADQNDAASSSRTITPSSFCFVRGQDIESIFFANTNNADSNPQQQQQEKQLLPFLVKDQLVWVCKSKGLKKRNRGNTKTSSSSEEQPQSQSHPQQRLEAFLRARIVHGDNTCKEHQAPSESKNENNINCMVGDNKETEIGKFGKSDDNGEQDEDEDRLLVRYPRGSTYKVRRDHLWPVLDDSVIDSWRRRRNTNNNNSSRMSGNSSLVLVFSETDFYRRACMVHTLPDSDIFWEIGCDYGVTVDKVASTLNNITNNGDDGGGSTRVLGIDKSQESIDEARRRFPHLPFCVWDILVNGDKASTNNESTTNGHTTTAACTSTNNIPFASPDHAIQDAVEATTSTTTIGGDNAGRTGTAQSTTSSVSSPSSSSPAPTTTTTYPSSCAAEYQQQHVVASPPTVVAMDIGGNRELPAVLACLEKVASLWKPRLILIKSRALHCQLSFPQGVQDAVLASMMAR